jgi:hypothetical protein
MCGAGALPGAFSSQTKAKYRAVIGKLCARTIQSASHFYGVARRSRAAGTNSGGKESALSFRSVVPLRRKTCPLRLVAPALCLKTGAGAVSVRSYFKKP